MSIIPKDKISTVSSVDLWINLQVFKPENICSYFWGRTDTFQVLCTSNWTMRWSVPCYRHQWAASTQFVLCFCAHSRSSRHSISAYHKLKSTFKNRKDSFSTNSMISSKPSPGSFFLMLLKETEKFHLHVLQLLMISETTVSQGQSSRSST